MCWTHEPELRVIPFVDRLHRVSLRVVTCPIESLGIITRGNLSVDVSAVAYYKVVDAVRSVIGIENLKGAIDQIAQTTLRKIVGKHTPDETLTETDQINLDIGGDLGRAQRHPAARKGTPAGLSLAHMRENDDRARDSAGRRACEATPRASVDLRA
jgi:hypothetical protein